MAYPAPIAGEPSLPTLSTPFATGGSPQPSGKKIRVRAHTRRLFRAPKPSKPKSAKTAPTLSAPRVPSDQAYVNSLANTQYGPQLAQNARFSSGVPTWYAQARQELLAHQAPVVQPTMPTPTGDQATDSRAMAAYGYQQQRAATQTSGNQFINNIAGGLSAMQANTLNQANAQRQGLLAQEGAFKVKAMGDLAQQRATNILKQSQIDAELAIASGNQKLAQEKLDQGDQALQYLNQYRQGQLGVQRSNARTQRINAKTNAQKARDQRAHSHIMEGIARAKNRNDYAKIQQQIAHWNSVGALNGAKLKAQTGLSVQKIAKMTPQQLSQWFKQHPEFQKTKGSSVFSPQQVATNTETYRSGVARLSQPAYRQIVRSQGFPAAQLILEKKLGIKDSDLQHAIYQIVRYGGVDKHTSNLLQTYFGIVVPPTR